MEFTLLDVSFGLVFWSAVTFVIVLLILKKYLWGPLIENLDKRERTIHEAMDRAEEARQKAEDTLGEYNAKLAEAREEVRSIVVKGKESAERMKAEILAETGVRANGLLERAKSEIDAERTKALKEIKQVVVDISIAAAEKMLKRNLTVDDHMRMIEETLTQLEKNS